MNNTSDDSIFCWPFDTGPYIGVAITRAVTGGVSFVACLAVVVMMLGLKKLLFFKQRLIFYLNVAAMINAFFIAIQGANYFPNTASYYFKVYCAATGFFDQTTQMSLFVAIGCVTADLFFTSVLHKEYKLDKLYIVLTFVMPLLVNWVPFVFDGYWKAGPWCWITKYERGSCNEIDKLTLALTFILWYGPAYIMLLVMLVVYIVIVVSIKRQKYRSGGVFSPEAEHERRILEKELKVLSWYPTIFLVISIFPLVNRIYDAIAKEEMLALWIMHAFFSPLRGGFIAMMYAFDRETVRRLWTLVKSKWIFCRFTSESHITDFTVHTDHGDSKLDFSAELSSSKETESLLH